MRSSNGYLQPRLPVELRFLPSRAVEKVPERAVLHEVVEEEVAEGRRKGVPVEAHDVSVP